MNKIVDFFKLDVDYSKRIFGIDLMRAVAIIFVITVHASMLDQVDTGYPWIPIMSGVQMFFALSGFLIGGILMKSFQNKEHFGIKDLWYFWVRRWFRTIPSYYLVLLINIFIVYFGIVREDFTQFNWKFFFFLQNFSSPFVGFFWESWSLSVLEWFYILFPIALVLIYFILKRFGVSKRYAFLTASILFVLTPLLLRIFVASKFDVDSFWLSVRIHKVMIFRLDSIALGLFAAYVKYWHPKIWFSIRNVCFILGLVLYFYVSYISYVPNDFYPKVLKIVLQSLGCVLLLPKLDSIKKAPMWLTKIVTHLSLTSYSMYLINLSIVGSILINTFPFNGEAQAWTLFGVYWIAILVLSTIFYKYYEAPITKLRDRFKKSESKSVIVKTEI